MLETKMRIASKIQLTDSIYEIEFTKQALFEHKPGQFINIMIDSLYLRRPISVCDENDKTLRIVCKVVGEGTRSLTNAEVGSEFNCLVGLGNGYDLSKCHGKTALIGGGVGVPPLYMLAKRLIALGIKPVIFMGFNSSGDAFYIDEFKALDLDVCVSTIDGSIGTKGFVTDAVREYEDCPEYIYSCGPEPMLKAVYSLGIDGQFSFEERMGCGFGVCMGCTCETLYGYKRICRDGPVLFREEIKWRT